MVAMMNKNLIQTTVNLPLVGETNFFSKSLRFNLELIFFRKFISTQVKIHELSFYQTIIFNFINEAFFFYQTLLGCPWAVFDNWHLKDQYKRNGNRVELAQQLSKYILYAGLINLILSPVIFLFAAIFCIFSYGDVSALDLAQYHTIDRQFTLEIRFYYL